MGKSTIYGHFQPEGKGNTPEVMAFYSGYLSDLSGPTGSPRNLPRRGPWKHVHRGALRSGVTGIF